MRKKQQERRKWDEESVEAEADVKKYSRKRWTQ